MDQQVVQARRRDVVAQRLEWHAAVAAGQLQLLERQRLRRRLAALRLHSWLRNDDHLADEDLVRVGDLRVRRRGSSTVIPKRRAILANVSPTRMRWKRGLAPGLALAVAGALVGCVVCGAVLGADDGPELGRVDGARIDGGGVRDGPCRRQQAGQEQHTGHAQGGGWR